ncbi:MAG: glycosyltransferase family 9 protein [Calditrichota bacterium]
MENSSRFDSNEAVAARETILVIRFSSLGDILLTAPALRALRRRYPNGHIDLLVADEFADAASLIRGPDRVLTFDRKSGLQGLFELRRRLSRRYSIVVDLQNSPRSLFLRLFTFPLVWVKAKRYRFRRWLLVRFKWNRYQQVLPVPQRYLNALSLFGVTDDEQGLELQIAEPTRVEALKNLTTDSPNKPLAILCPGARHFTKRWPGERWVELGKQLSAAGWQTAIIATEAERALGDELKRGIPGSELICGRTIPEIAGLFQQTNVVVCNDSGLMHLATGVGAPVAAIFADE